MEDRRMGKNHKPFLIQLDATGQIGLSYLDFKTFPAMQSHGFIVYAVYVPAILLSAVQQSAFFVHLGAPLLSVEGRALPSSPVHLVKEQGYLPFLDAKSDLFGGRKLARQARPAI